MSLKLLLLVGLVPSILARPNTYKETEDFHYSRSDSDQGQKSGFYAAQRGNMGGNFEKSHNMDHLAQNQMTDLSHQVSSQLGVDPAVLQSGLAGHGNLYGSASTSGLTSLSQQHLNSQSRLAGVKSAGYTQNGALSSHNQNNLGYGEEYYAGSSDRRSHETQQAYEARQRLASSSSRLNSQTHSNFGSGLEAGDTFQQTVVRPIYSGRHVVLTAQPGQVTHVVVPVRIPAGYDAQSQYTGSALTSTGSTYNRQSASANTDFVNENSEVTAQRGRSQYNGENVQTTDELATSQYNQREDENSRRAQNLNIGRSSGHQYGYNKQWERHGTGVTNTAPIGVDNIETGRASNMRNLQTDYNALNHNTEDQALETRSRQEYSQRYGKQWERQGSRVVPSTSVSHLSTDALTRSDRRHVNYEEQNVGTTNLHSATGSTNQAQRARANFNTGTASQALEAGTAYNADVELLNGQNLGTNLGLESTVVTTAPKRFESSYSYHKAWERKGTPYVIQPASSSLTDYNGQGALTSEGESQSLTSHRVTDQSSGQRAYFTKGGSQASALSGSSAHSTGIGSQSSLTENMARLQQSLQQQQDQMRTSLCDADCATAKSNKYEASYAYSRQHSYRKKRSPTKKNSNDYDYGKNYEDMGQQMEDFGQMPEDPGQISKDFGELPEEFGQQPENLNQMPVDFSHISATDEASKLGRTSGEKRIETNYNNFQLSRDEGHTARNAKEKTLGEQLVEVDYRNLQKLKVGSQTARGAEQNNNKFLTPGLETQSPRNSQEKTLGEQLVEVDYKVISQLGQPTKVNEQKTLGEQFVNAEKNNNKLHPPWVETDLTRNSQEKKFGEQLVDADYKTLLELGQTPKGNEQKTFGEQLVNADYDSLQKSNLKSQQSPTSYATIDGKIFRDNFFDDYLKKSVQMTQNLHDPNFRAYFGNFDNPNIDKSHRANQQISTSVSVEKPPKRMFDDASFTNNYRQQHPDDKLFNFQKETVTSNILDKPEKHLENINHPELTISIDKHIQPLNNIFNNLRIPFKPYDSNSDIYKPVSPLTYEHHNDGEPTQYFNHLNKPTTPATMFQYENQTTSATTYTFSQPLHKPFIDTSEFHKNLALQPNPAFHHTTAFHNNPAFHYNPDFLHNPAFHHNLQFHHNPAFHDNPAFHQDSSNTFIFNNPFHFTSQPKVFSYPFQSMLTSTTTQMNKDFGRSSLEKNVKEKIMENHLGSTNVATTEVNNFYHGLKPSDHNEPKNNPYAIETDKLFESLLPGLITDNYQNRDRPFNTYSRGQTVVSYNYSESNVQHFLVPSSTSRNQFNNYFHGPSEQSTTPSIKIEIEDEFRNTPTEAIQSSTSRNKFNNYYPGPEESTTQYINVEIEDDFRNPTTKFILNDKYHNRNMPKKPKIKTPAEIEILSLVRDQNESQLNHEINSDEKKERARGDIPKLDVEIKHSYNLFGETTEKTLVYSGDALVIRPKGEKLNQNTNTKEEIEQYDEQNLDQQIEDLGQELESFDNQMEDVAPIQIGNSYRETEKNLAYSANLPVPKPKTEKPKQKINPEENKKQYNEQNLDQQNEDLSQELVSFDEQKEEIAPLQIGNNHSEKSFIRQFVSDQNDMDWSIGPKKEHETSEYNKNMPRTTITKSSAEIEALSLTRDHNEQQYNNNPYKQKDQDDLPERGPTRKPTYQQFNRRPSSPSTEASLLEIDNLEQQIEVGQKTEDFNWKQQKPHLEYNVDLRSNTLEKIDPVDLELNKNDKMPDINEMPFDIDKILNEELKDLEVQNNIYNQHENKEKLIQDSSTHAQSTLATVSVNKFGKLEDLEQYNIEQLDQQSDTASWDQEIEKTQRQFDQVEEALDKYEHPHENSHSEKFVLDLQSKHDVVNNDNKPTLTSPLQEGEKVKDDLDQRAFDAAPAEESKPGLWRKMTKQFSKAKSKVTSWFS